MNLKGSRKIVIITRNLYQKKTKKISMLNSQKLRLEAVNSASGGLKIGHLHLPQQQ